MCILHHFLNKIQQQTLNCSYCWCIIHIRFFLDTKSQSIFLHQILQQLSEQNKHYASQHELHDSKLYKQLLNNYFWRAIDHDIRLHTLMVVSLITEGKTICVYSVQGLEKIMLVNTACRSLQVSLTHCAFIHALLRLVV